MTEDARAAARVTSSARAWKFGAAKEDTQKPALNNAKQGRLREILEQEIRVAEAQARLAREQQKTDAATVEQSLHADLEVMGLKRELSQLLDDQGQALALVQQQIRVLQDLERVVQEERKHGAAREANELKVRRQILSLQRQQAELE